MLPNISLNNLIDASTGLALMQLSISGLMCNRGMKSTSPPSTNGNNSCSTSNNCVTKDKSCSSVNFNLGLSSLGVTGVLLLYRGLRR